MVLCPGQGKYGFLALKGKSSKTNCIIWQKFEFIRDCMSVLETCNFKNIEIKNEGALPWTSLNMGFQAFKASNSKPSHRIWSNFEPV